VQIEKKYCYSILPASLVTSRGATVAEQHASLFPTRLALARWMHGGDIPHVPASDCAMPVRAAWYTQIQDHFQSWLDAGGFHRADDEPLACALHGQPIDTPFPVPGIGNWPAPDSH
jgi:hypothetical protein